MHQSDSSLASLLAELLELRALLLRDAHRCDRWLSKVREDVNCVQPSVAEYQQYEELLTELRLVERTIFQAKEAMRDST